jgi:hypothetical protein
MTCAILRPLDAFPPNPSPSPEAKIDLQP